ncbi:MAG: cytochrome c1 [Parvularculaceae bacterium]|nr:cytochrome c1 [Parvularculaceae bacterium]
MKKLFLALVAAMIVAPAALAAGGKVEPYKKGDWAFSGPFGVHDKEAVQRGFQVYRQVCSACHGVKLLAFRNLGDKGGPYHLEQCPEGIPEGTDCSDPNANPYVKAIAAEYQITDGPDDSGEMFQRPGIPADRLPQPFANEQVARLANGGALPPDLSLILKARKDGADYVYSLLTGYEEPPATVNLAPTQHYNPYFAGDMSQLLKEEFRDEEGHPKEGVEIPHGGVLAMAPPLVEGIVDYADEATPETVDQYAHDVVNFLAWASDPKMEQRKRLGFITVAYLLLLSGVLYWSYKTLWAKVDH